MLNYENISEKIYKTLLNFCGYKLKSKYDLLCLKPIIYIVLGLFNGRFSTRSVPTKIIRI